MSPSISSLSYTNFLSALTFTNLFGFQFDTEYLFFYSNSTVLTNKILYPMKVDKFSSGSFFAKE